MKNSLLLLLLACCIFSCKKEQPADNITNEYYTIVQCDSTAHDSLQTMLPSEFQAFSGIFDGEGVGAAINLTEDILVLFSLDGTKFAWFEDQQIQAEHNLSDNNHFLEGCPFNSISAATVLNSNKFYMFNEDGDEYTSATFSPENASGSYNDDDFMSFDSVFDLNLWGDDSIPYNAVSAIWNVSNANNTCFDATENFIHTNMVKFTGDEFVTYEGIYGSFSPSTEFANWSVENNCGGQDGLLPFESIGAACRYVKPNTIQELFFNLEGTQFTYYNVSEGIFSDVFDLY